jgi:hypothetical protein
MPDVLLARTTEQFEHALAIALRDAAAIVLKCDGHQTG